MNFFASALILYSLPFYLNFVKFNYLAQILEKKNYITGKSYQFLKYMGNIYHVVNITLRCHRLCCGKKIECSSCDS